MVQVSAWILRNRWPSRRRGNIRFTSAGKAGVLAVLSGRWIAMNYRVSSWSLVIAAWRWVRSLRLRSQSLPQQPSRQPQFQLSVKGPPVLVMNSRTHRWTTRRWGPRRRSETREIHAGCHPVRGGRDPAQVYVGRCPSPLLPTAPPPRRNDLPHSPSQHVWSENGKFRGSWKFNNHTFDFSVNLLKYTT